MFSQLIMLVLSNSRSYSIIICDLIVMLFKAYCFALVLRDVAVVCSWRASFPTGVLDRYLPIWQQDFYLLPNKEDKRILKYILSMLQISKIRFIWRLSILYIGESFAYCSLYIGAINSQMQYTFQARQFHTSMVKKYISDKTIPIH